MSVTLCTCTLNMIFNYMYLWPQLQASLFILMVILVTSRLPLQL